MVASSLSARALVLGVFLAAAAPFASQAGAQNTPATPAPVPAPAPAAAPAAGKTAAPAGEPVIIVVDTDRIRRECLAGASVDRQAGEYERQMEEENRKEEASLRAGGDELQKERQTLPADQFADKERAFSQRVADAQRLAQRRRQAFERSFNTAILKVQQAMIDATRDVAQSHSADVVLLRQALLFFNARMDATQEIIDLMNSRVTQVEMAPPKLEPDSPAATQTPVPTPAPKPKPAPKPQ